WLIKHCRQNCARLAPSLQHLIETRRTTFRLFGRGTRKVGHGHSQGSYPLRVTLSFQLRLPSRAAPSTIRCRHAGGVPVAREQRKLAAILAGDVVGYSRLMGRDESGTLARLRKNRSEHLDPVLKKYGGRLVKLTGDGALIEFASAVDALSAAI